MDKVAIYSRKSLFTGKGESIENQIEMCKDYYYRMYGRDVEFIEYEDEGYSGKNLKRPQFQEFLKDIKKSKFKALICYRLDRISRNVSDFSSTLELLQENNIDFISIKENFDTSTPMGRAMIYISSVFAQLERETIAERVRDNMMQLARTGRWLGGTPPLGFNSERETILDEDLKERTFSKLSRNTDEMKIVKLIFDKYIELESVNQVAKWCLLNNIKGKLGGDIDKSAVNIILQNPVYVKSSPEVMEYLKNQGYEVYGEPNKNGLLRYAQGDEENKTVAVGKHRGIINANDWIHVQKTLKENTLKAPNLGKTNTALLTGILKCYKCGANMTIKYGAAYKDNKKAFYYKCSNKTKTYGIKCNCSNINGDVAERLLVDSITAFDRSTFLKELDLLLRKSKTIEHTESENLSEEVVVLEEKIKRLLNKLSLTDDLDISKMIMDQIANYKKQIIELKNKMNEELNKEIEVALTKKEIEDYLTKFNDFKNIFANATVDEKRKLLTELFEKITWNEDTQELELYYKLSKKK